MTSIHPAADRSPWGRPATSLVLWLLMATVAGAGQRTAVAGQDAGAKQTGVTAPDVAPATFTRETGLPPAAPEPPSPQAAPAPRPSAAALTLAAPQPLAAKPPAASRGPLPDWKLLFAVAAAFGTLVAFRWVTAVRTSRTAPLPPDVFDVLGVASLGGGHSIRVVRFGPKTLLVSTSTAGCQTLAELTDPQATDRIAAACTTTGHPPRAVPRPRLVAGGGRAPA